MLRAALRPGPSSFILSSPRPVARLSPLVAPNLVLRAAVQGIDRRTPLSQKLPTYGLAPRRQFEGNCILADLESSDLEGLLCPLFLFIVLSG